MDIIECTRQLGKAIQEDEAYIAYSLAKENNDNDKELQDLIGEFNVLRLNVNNEVSKPDKDDEKVKEYNLKLQDCYKRVMENESMQTYNAAKNALDEKMTKVNAIISMCIEGENPETCQPPESNCTGSCSTCGGCH